MQIYIQKCPKIGLQSELGVFAHGKAEVKSSKFKVIYVALVLTLWGELCSLDISITYSLITINMCMQNPFNAY